MEHLSLPRKPIRRHPQIALSTKQFDDAGDFLTYPERHSGLITGSHPHVPKQVDVLTERKGAGVSSQDILDYYQGWLFFGILSEFLGPLFDSQNYVRVVWEGDKEEEEEDDDDDEEEEEKKEQDEEESMLPTGWGEEEEEEKAEEEEDKDEKEAEGANGANDGAEADQTTTQENEEDGAQEDNSNRKILKVLLTTARLHDDLAVWRSDGPLSTITPNSPYHEFLDSCLDAAFQALDDLESSFPGFTQAFPEDVLCLVSLLETLDSFICTALDHGPVAEMPHRMFPEQAKRRWLSKVLSVLDFDADAQPNDEGLILREPMLAAGWCPGDISRMRESFSSIASYYYFSNFKPDPSRPNLHASCPDWGCTVRAEVVAPAHMGGPDVTDLDCSCPGTAEFDEQDLIEIYERDEIPVFTIGITDEEGTVGLALSSVPLDEESQKDPANRYVALSHVWSEGMGNPHGNGLPFCRLSVVQYWAMMAQQLVRQSEEGTARDKDPYATGIEVETEPEVVAVNLWIDTMCCPATPGYGKNLCLAKMRDIYANAYAVLVRSEGLEEVRLGQFVEKPELGVMDLAAKLYTNPWMRRMWTLQEAVLAGMKKNNSHLTAVGGRLVLGFGGGLLSLESVVGLLKQAPAHEAALAFDMIGKFAVLTPMLYGFDDDEQFGHMRSASGNAFLAALTQALKYRSVSVPSDELICLATMLGVRVGNSAGEVPLIEHAGSEKEFENGMCELWRRIEKQDKGIPGNIIFSSVPRINVDGFRWAPRTFIQHAKYGEVYWSSSSDDDDGDDEKKESFRPRITEHGLQVRYPGIKLEVDLKLYGTPLVQQTTNDAPKARAQRVFFMQIPADSGDWYSVHIHQLDQEDLEDRLDQLSLGPTLAEQLGAGGMALLLKQAEPQGRGLLVKINDDTSSRIQVKSKYPVSIRAVPPTTAYICTAVQQHFSQLKESLSAAGEDQTAREAALNKSLEELLSQEETGRLRGALLFDVLMGGQTSATDEQVLDIFFRTANLIAELGGVQGTLMSADQSWIVD